ncbi:MAG: hypothetical protein AAGE90_16125 [Pseudomonadota bacterium]
MMPFLRLLYSATLVLFALIARAEPAHVEGVPQIRLANDLGSPGEGYCIDVVGVGRDARADLPLVVHNCLPKRGSADLTLLPGPGPGGKV